MKCYLAGPMRGLVNYNFAAFDDAADRWRAKGWTVYSPAEFDRETVGCERRDMSPACMEKISHLSIRDCFRKDMVAICDSDAIVLLEGWPLSAGVVPELALARVLNLRVLIDGKD